jgi:hypothetical protein
MAQNNNSPGKVNPNIKQNPAELFFLRLIPIKKLRPAAGFAF